MNPELLAMLEELAERKTWADEDQETGDLFNPCEWSGGNYDDAYAGGVEQGRTELAREVLHALGVKDYSDKM